LIFDGEGVVIDTEGLWDDVQEEFLARRGRTYDRALVKPQLTGRPLVESTAVLQELYDLDGTTDVLAAERLALMAERLRQGAAFITGFPWYFESVRGRYVTCLATSLHEDLFNAVDLRLGLTALFEGRVVIDRDVPRGKPEPDLFLAAATKAGVPADACAVFEDSPVGIVAAHAAGMPVIALATTYDPRVLAEAGADAVVDDFASLA
jgi:beta-phosphoglucomutase-like phosphatase (HAD superfamily)